MQATLILFLSQKGPTFEFCIKLYIINYFVVQLYNRNFKIHVLYLICCAKKQYYIAVNLAFDYNAVHYSFVIIYCMFSIVHDIVTRLLYNIQGGSKKSKLLISGEYVNETEKIGGM